LGSQSFPFVSGSVTVSSTVPDIFKATSFDQIRFSFSDLMTPRGVVKVSTVSLSGLFANLGVTINPGSVMFPPSITPSDLSRDPSVSLNGLISGNFGFLFPVIGSLTETNIPFSNATFNVSGTILPPNRPREGNPPTPENKLNEINIVVRAGNVLFPASDIKNAEAVATEQVRKQRASEAIENTIEQTETGIATTTVNAPSVSAVATSTVHPDVNNRNPIDVRADQARVSSANFLSQGRTSDAFASIEGNLGSQLSSFTGRNFVSPSLSLTESLGEITKWSELSNSPTAAIYPVILRDRLEILVLLPEVAASPSRKASPARSFRTSVPVPQEALEGLIEKFRDNLQDNSSSDYLNEAKILYDILIRPIDAELQASGISTLVFAMDGDLRSIPVSALYDGEKFLVQKYASATVPSLQLANVSSAKRNTDVNILAVGLTDSVQGFSALPNVKTEIDTIGSKILSGTSFFNEDFTVDNIQAQRRKQPYNIIHLATHAEFDLENAEDSFILFWDRKVRTNQLPKLNLSNIELLTLSACQTAVGNNLGLSGSALSAGVKTVLASLWSVSDAGTAPLMMKFYSNYVDASSKAIALQKSQIALIDGSVKIENNTIKGIPNVESIPIGELSQKVDLKHPFFWSSFILVGNWL
jgi:CHAT domain-containing protein